MNRPVFKPGRNLAMKVPSHEYERTVAFYRDILGLRQLDPAPSATESVRFEFGDKILWIDDVPAMTQAELWLEVVADDLEQAASYLDANGIARRDEVELLPEGFGGFWISSPSNIIHLVIQA
jgi:catechol 2,3-dioxygenase-like lactoylglutathione lyase family enzyme